LSQQVFARIGCSGWNYKSWRERFYPREPPPARWLAYYADTFDTVEVNNTFYRLPERTTFASIYCVWMISSERCRDRGVAGSYVM
jgi:uncharacterized protein YecE (DUF72 family)